MIITTHQFVCDICGAAGEIKSCTWSPFAIKGLIEPPPLTGDLLSYPMGVHQVCHTCYDIGIKHAIDKRRSEKA